MTKTAKYEDINNEISDFNGYFLGKMSTEK